MQGDLIKGHLELLLLAVVEQGPAHGYAIIEELRRRSREAFDLPEGTVYPALHRLEKAGVLRSSWDDSTGRRRRVYEITGKGRRAVAGQRQDWAAFAEAVRFVIERGATCAAI